MDPGLSAKHTLTDSDTVAGEVLYDTLSRIVWIVTIWINDYCEYGTDLWLWNKIETDVFECKEAFVDGRWPMSSDPGNISVYNLGCDMFVYSLLITLSSRQTSISQFFSQTKLLRTLWRIRIYIHMYNTLKRKTIVYSTEFIVYSTKVFDCLLQQNRFSKQNLMCEQNAHVFENKTFSNINYLYSWEQN